MLKQHVYHHSKGSKGHLGTNYPVQCVEPGTPSIWRIISLIILNNHKKINTLEEIEILKAASSKYMRNDVIAG